MTFCCPGHEEFRGEHVRLADQVGFAERRTPNAGRGPRQVEIVNRADVWVVVLNYQGAEDTRECVGSLRQHVPWATILVVDNGSTDGLAAELASCSDVGLLRLPENLGYTGGNNAGIRAALDQGARVVCVLNNDTVALDDFLSPLVGRVVGRASAVSPVIKYRGGNGVWFEGGVLDTSAGDAWPRHGKPHELHPYMEGIRTSELLTGCCLVASRETWDTVGLFDERFFLNFEDSEWSVRARAAGVQLEVVRDTVIEHKVSQSFVGAMSALGGYYYLRNALLFQQAVGPRNRRARVRWVVMRVGRPLVGGLLRGRQDRLGLLMQAYAIRDHVRGRYGRAGAGVARQAGKAARPSGR